MTTVYCDNAGALTANCGLTLDLWMNPLKSRLPGAVPAQIECELHAAIREFYFQSRAWREQFGPYNIYANQDLVWLNPVDAYSNVMFVHGAWIEDPDTGRLNLKPLTFRPTDGQVGDALYFQAADPSVLRLWPKPAASLGAVLWVDASLVPAPDATRLPNMAQSHHFEAILEGALSRMHMMSNKPWTDPMLGTRYNQTFRRRCMEFRAISDQGYLMADKGWRFPAFA
jgi:hypothetical protein